MNKLERILQKIPKKVKKSALFILLCGTLFKGDSSPKYNPREILRQYGFNLEDVCYNNVPDYKPKKRNLTAQDIADYAQLYVGSPYGKQIKPCRALDAKQERCRMQCGAFVTSAYKFAAKNHGQKIELPTGNGKDKCDSKAMQYCKFNDPELLQPGDVFVAKSNSRYGHTGIYVGRGFVKDKVGEAYTKFIPNKKGEPVFVHATSPVIGYNTLRQLKKTRKVIKYCRHKRFCKNEKK